jgi:hypothetical protein
VHVDGLGTIRVNQYGSLWVLNTANVCRFGWALDPMEEGLKMWSIDGMDFAEPLRVGLSYLHSEEEEMWKVGSLVMICRPRCHWEEAERFLHCAVKLSKDMFLHTVQCHYGMERLPFDFATLANGMHALVAYICRTCLPPCLHAIAGHYT